MSPRLFIVPNRSPRTRKLLLATSLGACLAIAGCIGSATPLPGTVDAGLETAQTDTGQLDTAEDWCPGQWVVIDNERFCVDAIGATETGFQCPPDMVPYGGQGFGWAACGPDGFGDAQEQMPQEIIAQNGLACGEMKLDILVVMDISTSMCEEQVAMSAAMKDFTTQLEGYDADIQVAVTSVDASCELGTPGVHASQGQFNQVPADRFPAACYRKSQEICEKDEDCGDPAEWKCSKENLEVCIENPNGSINTSCRRLCDTDADCAELGPTAICLKPGGVSDSGCMVPPDTDDCPPLVGPILDNASIGDLECAMTTGVYSSKCFKYEQGLKSAWMALDPNGPMPVQSQVFLRPDARLAIIFITDEDDCSTATADSLSEDEFNTCAFLDDTDNGGPLMPVSDLVAKYKSLKSNPSMVSVLAIAGDSLAVDGADKQADRAAFALSKQDPRTCHQKSYICSSEQGIADWGSRYHALTEGFGDNGLFRNICSPEETGSAFTDLLGNLESAYIAGCSPQ